MEADWEVEIGGDAPIIDGSWPGRIDLERAPDRINEIAELRQLPSLADILLRLNNSSSSQVSTSKCDVWPVDQFDADELDAPPESAQTALACYIDLLPRKDQHWTSPARMVSSCKDMCAFLHRVALRGCRVDFVVRRAYSETEGDFLGITAYVTACGSTVGMAQGSLLAAVSALADALTFDAEPPALLSQLQ